MYLGADRFCTISRIAYGIHLFELNWQCHKEHICTGAPSMWKRLSKSPLTTSSRIVNVQQIQS